MIRSTAQDRDQLKRLSRLLEQAGAGGDHAGCEGEGMERVTLGFGLPGAAAGPTAQENRETVELPRTAVAALLDIARVLAKGQALHIVPHEAEMTTQAAADLLGVSRPHLITLIDRGELAFHLVGTHRRLMSDDVLAYRERRNAARREAVHQAQRLAADVEGDY